MTSEKGGQPPKFNSVEELQAKIDRYYSECEAKELPYTITGLCLALDITRQTLLNYQNKDEYFDTIKKAKLKCENYAEQQLFTGKNVAGVIFNMKNNYGWVDKIENKITGDEDAPLVVSVKDKLLSKLTEEELEALIED